MRVGVVVVLAAFVAVVGCKKKEVSLKDGETPPPASCSNDADCAIVDVPNCCICCKGGGIYAVAKKGPTYQRDCTEVGCKRCVGGEHAELGDCQGMRPPNEYAAVCRGGRCAAELKSAAAGTMELFPAHLPDGGSTGRFETVPSRP